MAGNTTSQQLSVDQIIAFIDTLATYEQYNNQPAKTFRGFAIPFQDNGFEKFIDSLTDEQKKSIEIPGIATLEDGADKYLENYRRHVSSLVDNYVTDRVAMDNLIRTLTDDARTMSVYVGNNGRSNPNNDAAFKRLQNVFLAIDYRANLLTPGQQQAFAKVGDIYKKLATVDVNGNVRFNGSRGNEPVSGSERLKVDTLLIRDAAREISDLSKAVSVSADGWASYRNRLENLRTRVGELAKGQTGPLQAEAMYNVQNMFNYLAAWSVSTDATASDADRQSARSTVQDYMKLFYGKDTAQKNGTAIPDAIVARVDAAMSSSPSQRFTREAYNEAWKNAGISVENDQSETNPATVNEPGNRSNSSSQRSATNPGGNTQSTKTWGQLINSGADGIGGTYRGWVRELSGGDPDLDNALGYGGDVKDKLVSTFSAAADGMSGSTKTLLKSGASFIAALFAGRFLLDKIGLKQGGFLNGLGSLAIAGLVFAFAKGYFSRTTTDGPDYRAPATYVANNGGQHAATNLLAGNGNYNQQTGAPQIPTDSVDAPAAGRPAGAAGTTPSDAAAAGASASASTSASTSGGTTPTPTNAAADAAAQAAPTAVRVQCVSANGTCTSIELPVGATPEERDVLEAGRKAEDSAKNETVSQGSGRHIGTDLVVTPGTVQMGRGGYTPVEFKGLDSNAIRVASLENTVAANGNDPVYRTLGDVKTLQARNATLARTGTDPNAAMALSI